MKNMEILKVITKEVFEQHVPAAKMPERNTGVLDRLQTEIEMQYGSIVRNIVGTELQGILDEEGVLRQTVIRMVCLGSFMKTMRSLDLVLTATGFGIVSTESTAPASKARVDALYEECGEKLLLATGRLLTELTKKDGWGASDCAAYYIPTLFYRPMLLQRTTLPLTTANWQKARSMAVTADALLRREISEEYMNELLVKTRTASLNNADIIITDLCNNFTADYISADGTPNHFLKQRLVEQLENYPQSYPTYQQSRLYRKRHAERFQNSPEDPTFFFV